MSIAKDQCVIMGRLQIDLAREFAKAPTPIDPDSPPICTDANSAPLVGDGESVLLINSISKDEE